MQALIDLDNNGEVMAVSYLCRTEEQERILSQVVRPIFKRKNSFRQRLAKFSLPWAAAIVTLLPYSDTASNLLDCLQVIAMESGID